MKRFMGISAVSFGMLFCIWNANAADHIDSPAPIATPAADITDYFAWMTPDATHVNLVMTVSPFATADSQWSDAIVYAMHVSSMEGYGAEDVEKSQLICRFYNADGSGVECWMGDEYVAGDPSDPAGIWSESGMIRVYAGLRNDPFFFEFTGFQNAVSTVIGAASSLEFDDEGCPAVDEATSGVLVGQLQSGADGAEASDTFAGANVLALVVQIDKSLVNGGGQFLSTWASTHAIAE